MELLYYITGHGYGHIVRSVEIIKSMVKINPHIKIHIRTSAPAWLFSEILNNNIKLYDISIDVGVVQKNSFNVDKKATLSACIDLEQKSQKFFALESTFVRQNKIQTILADIPPLAFDIASNCAIPAYAVGNFSWDWIYSDFIPDVSEFLNIVKDIRQSYAKATGLFQLPFAGDMSAFSNIIYTPLVTRKADMTKIAARESLGIKTKDKLVLIALRKQDLSDVDWNAVQKIGSYCFLISSMNPEISNVTYIPEGTLSFTNILNASDMVLSKPGYSLLSECLANQIRILYIPRENFIEDTPLLKALEQTIIGKKLLHKNFIKGDWKTGLDNLANDKRKWMSIDVNGADFIARQIVK